MVISTHSCVGSIVFPHLSLLGRELMGLEDSVGHTIVEFVAFAEERTLFVRQISAFAPGKMVSSMLESPASWVVVAEFAEAVMSRKERVRRARDQEEVILTLILG